MKKKLFHTVCKMHPPWSNKDKFLTRLIAVNVVTEHNLIKMGYKVSG